MIIGLICLLFTLGVYWTSKKVYSAKPKIYLSPLLVTPVVLILCLLIAKVPFESYNSGAKWLTDLLQPATIAFAIPLYKYYNVLKKHAVVIFVSVLSGSLVAMITSAFLGKWMHMDSDLVNSLVPRSVTTPIAMNVSQIIGGVPNMTAVFVIITGLMGSLIGPSMLKLFRIENEIARGVLLGTSAHGMGTSKAFEFSSLSGTISSISMILAALITLGIAPVFISLIVS